MALTAPRIVFQIRGARPPGRWDEGREEERSRMLKNEPTTDGWWADRVDGRTDGRTDGVERTNKPRAEANEREPRLSEDETTDGDAGCDSDIDDGTLSSSRPLSKYVLQSSHIMYSSSSWG